MRNPRLYVDLPLAAGETVTLPEAAGHYLRRVLRLGSGDALIVFDGRGGEYEATVTRASRAVVEVAVGAHRAVERESTLAVEVGQGICKGDRMDLVVRKATELGVRAIHPLLCERTVVQLDPARAVRRVAHWRAVAVHAAQQSGRTRIPHVAAVEELGTWLSHPGLSHPGLSHPGLSHPGLSHPADSSAGATTSDGGGGAPGTWRPRPEGGLKIVLSPQARASLPDLAPPAPGKTVRLLVGPEGGVAPREVEHARAAGFTGLRLGPRVLRTETAALVALSILQARWGDLE